jgi:hypothetical protein
VPVGHLVRSWSPCAEPPIRTIAAPPHDRRRPALLLVRRRARFLAVGALAVLSCSESTAPPTPEPFAVALHVAKIYDPELFVLPDGPVMACGVDIDAVATGDGIARWEGATFYWFAGPSRSTAIDSLRISGNEVRRSFERDSISAVRNERSEWDISGRAPFDILMRFRFLVKGETTARTAEVRFTCGPAVPAGTVLAPTMSITSMTPGGEMEPGDTVRVSYSASSAFGLWITGVAVEDAFLFNHGFAEGLLPDAMNTVEVPIPWHSTLGASLDLTVYAIDGMLQVTQQVVGADIQIVDHTPPRITSSSSPAAQYAVGQQFNVDVQAADNHQLQWIVWELGAPVGIKDSTLALAHVPITSWRLPFTVQPSWVGTTTLRLYVRDAAGHLSDVVTVPSGGITFVPAAVQAARAP